MAGDQGSRGHATQGPRGGVSVTRGGRLLGRLGRWARGPLAGRRGSGQVEGQGRGADGAAPFIVGAERSGTTLLRLMLDAHPEMAIPPETHFIERAAEACGGAPDPRRAFLETVTSHRRWGDFRIREERLAERVSGIKPFDLGEALRAFYGVYAERFGKPRWGDKTPNYVYRMSLIHGLLPEAHFVHIIRDGRDVALSTKDLWFGPDSVEEAARRWRSLVEEARRQSEGLPHYMEVRYEDLVTDTEATLKGVAGFVDLRWDPGMLAYHTTADERLKEIHRDIETPKGKKVVRGEMRRSLHTLTGKPPQRDRIARWRTEMDEADRRRFEEVAGETLRGLGYEVG